MFLGDEAARDEDHPLRATLLGGRRHICNALRTPQKRPVSWNRHWQEKVPDSCMRVRASCMQVTERKHAPGCRP